MVSKKGFCAPLLDEETVAEMVENKDVFYLESMTAKWGTEQYNPLKNGSYFARVPKHDSLLLVNE